MPADSVTSQQYDTFLQSFLGAGDYTVSVMQYYNFARGPNLSDGFRETGANFTFIYECSNGMFCDATGDNRDGHWAFDVLNVESASAVPEPGTLGLLSMGLAGIAALRKRRRK